MQRIAVIGSCPKGHCTLVVYRFAYGAGKSTLATTLGKKLNLPVIHLDAYYWQSGWRETASDRWQEIHQKLIEGDCWIIDGNYGNTMDLRLEAADTVIWLDFNRYLCLWRVVKRYLQYAGKIRPDMATGCSEQLNWEFLQYVWNFPALHRSKTVERLANFSGSKRIIVLQNSSQLSDLLQQLYRSREKKSK